MVRTWTKITKATQMGGSQTTNPGNPIGLLLSLTYATSNTISVGGWKKITKATGTAWNKITKPI